MSEAENLTNLPENPASHAADALYGVSRWGEGLISVLDNGHIGLLHPSRPEARPTDLMSVLDNLEQRGISAPVLLRVADFIEWRIDQINEAFNGAICELDYGGS